MTLLARLFRRLIARVVADLDQIERMDWEARRVARLKRIAERNTR